MSDISRSEGLAGWAARLASYEHEIQLDPEHECLLIYSHVGVRSEFVQGSASPTLDVLARRGFVCGVTAKAENTGLASIAAAEGWYEPLVPLA
jgi:hypothetical protein